MIEIDLRTHLLAQAPIAAIVGTRMFPMQLPQGATLPALTYQTIAGASGITHDGASDLGRHRIQIDCWAPSGNTGYQQVVELAAAVNSAVSGYMGSMGSNPATNGRKINVRDIPEPETKLWRRMVEISLWHKEN